MGSHSRARVTAVAAFRWALRLQQHVFFDDEQAFIDAASSPTSDAPRPCSLINTPTGTQAPAAPLLIYMKGLIIHNMGQTAISACHVDDTGSHFRHIDVTPHRRHTDAEAAARATHAQCRIMEPAGAYATLRDVQAQTRDRRRGSDRRGGACRDAALGPRLLPRAPGAHQAPGKVRARRRVAQGARSL